MLDPSVVAQIDQQNFIDNLAADYEADPVAGDAAALRPPNPALQNLLGEQPLQDANGIGNYVSKTPDPAMAPVAERGLMGDLGSGLARGGVSLLDTTAHAVDTLTPGGSQLARSASEYLTKLPETTPLLRPDVSEAAGTEGAIKKGAMSAAQSMPESLAILPAAAIGGMVAGPVGAAIGGGAALLGLFGAGQYGKKKEEVVKTLSETRPDLKPEQIEDMAHKNALTTAYAEVGGEGAGDLAAALVFKSLPGGTALYKGGKAILKELVNPSFIKTLGKGLAKIAPFEVASEVGTSYFQNEADKALGINQSTTKQAMLDSIIPALFLSTGMGTALGGYNAYQRKQAYDSLNVGTPEERLAAAQSVAGSLNEATDEKVAGQWMGMAEATIKAGQQIPLDFNIAELAAGRPDGGPDPALQRNLAAAELRKANLPTRDLIALKNGEALDPIIPFTAASLESRGITAEHIDAILNERADSLGSARQRLDEVQAAGKGGPLTKVSQLVVADDANVLDAEHIRRQTQLRTDAARADAAFQQYDPEAPAGQPAAQTGIPVSNREETGIPVTKILDPATEVDWNNQERQSLAQRRAANTAVANSEEYKQWASAASMALQNAGLRQEEIGPVVTPEVYQRQLRESQADTTKSFAPGQAADVATKDPRNVDILAGWNQDHFNTNDNGEVEKVQKDHFATWHETGGVDSDVGSQYDAHGIAKSNPLGSLLNILENGINPNYRFDSAPLTTAKGASAGLGTAGGAYKDGPFILLSGRGQELKKGGIQTVLVSDEVSSTIPALQARFPNIRFTKYSDAQNTLAQDVAAKPKFNELNNFEDRAEITATTGPITLDPGQAPPVTSETSALAKQKELTPEQSKAEMAYNLRQATDEQDAAAAQAEWEKQTAAAREHNTKINTTGKLGARRAAAKAAEAQKAADAAVVKEAARREAIDAINKKDPLYAQKQALKESIEAQGTVPETGGNIDATEAQKFERQVNIERARTRAVARAAREKEEDAALDAVLKDQAIPKEVKAAAKAEAMGVIKSNPIYAHADEIKKRGKLNSELLAKTYSSDAIRELSRRHPGIMAKTGTQRADTIASELGYEDADAMITALTGAKTQKELEVEFTQQKKDEWENAEAASKQEAPAAEEPAAEPVAEEEDKIVFMKDHQVATLAEQIENNPRSFNARSFDGPEYNDRQRAHLQAAYAAAWVRPQQNPGESAKAYRRRALADKAEYLGEETQNSKSATEETTRESTTEGIPAAERETTQEVLTKEQRGKIRKALSSLSPVQRQAAEALIRTGKIQVLTQAEAEAMTGVNEDGTQGFVENGRTYLIPENMAPGNLWGLIRHEIGTHVGKLVREGKDFKALLKSIHARQLEKGATGDAIRAAYTRVDLDENNWGKSDDARAEEALAYLVEDARDLTLVQRFIQKVKDALRSIGINPGNFTVEDLTALADAAIHQVAGTDVRKVADGVYANRTSMAGDPSRSVRTFKGSLKKFRELNKELRIVDDKTLRKWEKDIQDVAHMVISGRDRLNYDASDLYSSIKENSDPHYVWSLDFSTICKKRVQMAATIELLQQKLGRGVTPDEIGRVVEALRKKGITVSCGGCYVEASRAGWGLAVNRFLNNNKQYEPLREKFLTQDGLEDLAANHREAYDKIGRYIQPQLIKMAQARTEYKDELLNKTKEEAPFGNPITDTDVKKFNSRSGMRWQSWSDFELPHLIDAMQAVLHMKARGLKGHTYTKVAEMIEALGQTGMMFNMSLIPKGQTGIKNGKLDFSPIEGMPWDTAIDLRDRHSQTAGTIAIGISDEHIRMLMADPEIDYIIPYHHSNMPMEIRKRIGIDQWTDYSETQREGIADKALLKEKSRAYLKTLKLTDKQRAKLDKKSGIEQFEEWSGRVAEWWDPKLTGDQNAQVYLAKAAEWGVKPKFEQFSQEPGYWKTLIDRKMYDNEGNSIVQGLVTPNYDMDKIQALLKAYKPEPTKGDQATVDLMLGEFPKTLPIDTMLTGANKKAITHNDLLNIKNPTKIEQNSIDDLHKRLANGVLGQRDVAKGSSIRGLERFRRIGFKYLFELDKLETAFPGKAKAMQKIVAKYEKLSDAQLQNIAGEPLEVQRSKTGPVLGKRIDRKGYGPSYPIKVGSKRVGHISGSESYAGSAGDISKQLGFTGEYFDLRATEMDEAFRGSGKYQEFIQAIAPDFEKGVVVKKFQASPLLQKALRKIPGVVETEDFFHVQQSKDDDKAAAGIAKGSGYQEDLPRRSKFKPVDPNDPKLKAWMGDSKITTPFYHGTPENFEAFDKTKLGKNRLSPGAGIGHFFAMDRNESMSYAGPQGKVQSFFLRLENPKTMNSYELPNFRSVEEAQAWAKRQQLAGYDGLILEDEGHAVVFENNQVKSAELNTGDFDPNDARFNRSKYKPVDVESEAFKRFFKESKVVDEKGKPLVQMHSTKSDILSFDIENSDLGAHFGTADQSNHFGAPDGRRTYPVYLSIQNPLRLVDHGYFGFDSVAGQLADEGIISEESFEEYWDKKPAVQDDFIRAAIKAAGYDGVVYLNRREGVTVDEDDQGGWEQEVSDTEFLERYPEAKDSYIALRRDQIKSAISNTGDFQGDEILRSKAFHGSPHNVDKFKSEKIGTGEGAQAYGHGLYFTDSEEVAKWYRDSLSTPNGRAAEFELMGAHPEVYQELYDRMASMDFELGWGDPEESISTIIQSIIIEKLQGKGTGNRHVRETVGPDLYKKIEAVVDKKKGHMYEVDLAPEEDEYLLWDKPLTEQSAKVQAALEKKFSLPSFIKDYPIARDFYKVRVKKFQSQKKASDELQSLGIRGIKYLDGSSRQQNFDPDLDIYSMMGGYAITEKMGGGVFDTKAEAVAELEKRNPANFNYVIFNEDDITIKRQYSKRVYDAATIQAKKNVGAIVEPVTLRDWWTETQKDLKLKIQHYLVDQYAPLKKLGSDVYQQARMAAGQGGALEAMMHFGDLILRDGVTDVEVGKTKGIIEALQALQGEQHDFLWWIAANRAEKLTAEERENLFEKADIDTIKKLNQGKMPDGQDRAKLYKEVLKDYVRANKNVMDIAEQSELIDSETRASWEHDMYVPFYRAKEDGVDAPRGSGGLVRQYAFKQLKGGTRKLHNDLLANVLMNWSHVLDASAKNRAAAKALKAAEDMDVAEYIGESPQGKNTVFYLGRFDKKVKAGSKYLEDGVEKIADEDMTVSMWGKKYYTVSDPLVLESLNALEFTGFKGAAMDALTKTKRLLTMGVTANPAFKIRNFIRDSMTGVGISPLSYNPAANAAQGFRAMRAKGQTYASLLAGGGIIRFGSMLEDNSAAHVDKLVNAGVKRTDILDTKEKITGFFSGLWNRYNDVGDISEGANRAALYEQLKAKGLSHAEASYQARDMMDFHLKGAGPAVRFLAQTVPFFNARAQGLYKLARAGHANPKRFGAVVGATALASIALMLAYKDDDDWKQREDWDRDTYFWFKFGNRTLRIPKGFEIGAIATLAERGLEVFVDDEMTAKRFGDRVLAMLGQTLSFNPTPQIIKPLVDLYADKDSFTGRPIEGPMLEGLLKSDRQTNRTSEMAKLIGSAGDTTGISPVQVDHLIRGYFGWLGTAASTLIDLAARPVMGRPEKEDMRLRDMFLAGNFLETLPRGSSRYVTEFYDQAKEIQQTWASIRDGIKRGEARPADAGQIHAQALQASRAQKLMSVMTNRIRAVENSNLSGSEKRKQIDLLTERKNQLARKALR